MQQSYGKFDRAERLTQHVIELFDLVEIVPDIDVADIDLIKRDAAYFESPSTISSKPRKKWNTPFAAIPARLAALRSHGRRFIQPEVLPAVQYGANSNAIPWVGATPWGK